MHYEPTNAACRHRILATLLRRYPLKSGRASLANHQLISWFAGDSDRTVWAGVPGGQVLVPLNDFVGRAAYYCGDLDPKLTWLCKQIVSPGDTVLDIGANFGILTTYLARLVGANGMVHAVEPNPIVCACLQRTLDRNQMTHVRAHSVALGSTPGQLELRVPYGNAGGGSLIRRHDPLHCNAVSVPVHTLDSVVASCGITNIRLIKIDVEGFERDVIAGGESTFRLLKPHSVVFEANDSSNHSQSDREVLSLLLEFGYRVFGVPKCRFRMRLHPVDLDSTLQEFHDFLAVRDGATPESINRIVRPRCR